MRLQTSLLSLTVTLCQQNPSLKVYTARKGLARPYLELWDAFADVALDGAAGHVVPGGVGGGGVEALVAGGVRLVSRPAVVRAQLAVRPQPLRRVPRLVAPQRPVVFVLKECP